MPPLASLVRTQPRSLALLLLVCALSSCARLALASPKRCAQDVGAPHCSFRGAGVYYYFNDSSTVYVSPEKLRSKFTPLSVPPNHTLSIAACHLENGRVDSATLRNKTLVPTLVRGVGSGARVRVLVYNSANVEVKDRFVVGHDLPGGRTSAPGNETALVENVVTGPIGDHAEVEVRVLESANLRLWHGAKEVAIGGGTLLNEVINAGGEGTCAKGVCVEVKVRNSANVEGRDGRAAVLIVDGQLEDESVDVGCFNEGSISLEKNNVANVRDVKKLTVRDGELSDEAIDGGNVKGSNVFIKLEEVGNVRATGNVTVVDGELVDEIVDVRNVSTSNLRVTGSRIANVRANSLTIDEGELLDEALDAHDVTSSTLKVSLTDAANVRLDGKLSIRQGELVDELTDVRDVRASKINVELQNVGNVQSADVALLSSAQLLDEALDARDISESSVNVGLRDSANAHVRGTITIDGGELLDEVVDVKTVTGGHLRVAVINTGNVQCTREGALVLTKGGRLVDRILDVEGGLDEKAKAKVDVRDSANAKVKVHGNATSLLHTPVYAGKNNKKKLQVNIVNSGKVKCEECQSRSRCEAKKV